MSNTTKEQVEFYPLATNILKLQYYSGFFDLTEIVMFDWFVVKAKSFKYKQFYYSRRRITEEVRIKEDRLTTIIERFAALGIIEIEIKGMPKQHHFTIDFDKIIALIPKIFQLAENSKLSADNSKLLAFFGKQSTESSTQKKYNKESNKEPIQEELRKEQNMVGIGIPTSDNLFSNGNNDLLDFKKQKAKEAAERKAQKEAEQAEKHRELNIKNLKDMLNRIYAERVAMHNKKIKKGGRIKSVTKLSFLRRNENALYELGQLQEMEEIKNSFIAYVDDFLDGSIEVKKLIPYFLFRKPKTKDFDTFHTYLNKFIADYSQVKN